MDMKMLVEKITKDVLESMNDKERSQPVPVMAPPPKGDGKKNVSVVVDMLPEKRMLEHLAQICSGEVTVLRCGDAGGAENAIRAHITVKDVVHCDGRSEIRSRMNPGETLIYLASRPYHLSSLADLLDSYPSVRIALEALSCGVGVIVLDGVERSGKPWEAKLEVYHKEIAAMGVSVEQVKAGARTVLAQMQSASVSSQCPGDKEECLGCGKCATLAPQKVSVVVGAGAERISGAPGVTSINKEVAAMIDHTLLKQDATQDDVIKLCKEARECVFASVCINPGFVKLAYECLKGSPVKVCTVIGFPLGATTSVTKAIETRDAIANGADEIDMVINVGALKAGNYDLVQQDIEAVVQAASGKLVKVIIEAALLTDEEKVMACKLSQRAGADFVKTSTGFGPGGATAHDVELMRKTVGKYMGVKASGGIRDFETAQKMIMAGATRIGASASVAIVKGGKSESTY